MQYLWPMAEKENTYRHILLYSRWFFQLTALKSHFIHGPSASFVSQWESVQVFWFSDVPLSWICIRWSRTLQVFEHNWAPQKYSIPSHFAGCLKEIPIGTYMVTQRLYTLCIKKNAKELLWFKIYSSVLEIKCIFLLLHDLWWCSPSFRNKSV